MLDHTLAHGCIRERAACDRRKGRRSAMKKIVLLLAATAAPFATSLAAQESIAPGAKVSVVFDQQLPNVPGKSLRAVLVEYAPGAGSPSHRHPTSAFIYARVLEGAIRSKVNHEPERKVDTGIARSPFPTNT
jgi:quercetin dioxygenase-like cupin family protein